ncbi:MAG: class I SAM-dependent methyltransferase [Pseudonocardiaceae bacterium]
MYRSGSTPLGWCGSCIASHPGQYPGAGSLEEIDLIICIGVMHHMPDPQAGLHWLGRHLTDDGLLYLWLYNALGEHGRMLDRELVQLFTSVNKGKSTLEIVRALGITLSPTQYGLSADWPGSGMNTASKDVVEADAHPRDKISPQF